MNANKRKLGAIVSTAAFVLACSAGSARALERPGDPAWAGEAQGGPWANGVYVVGDSISFWVPYGPTGESLGMHTWWRVGIGWSTYGHNHTLWGSGNQTSFQAAASSPASTVFVQLGTNDVSCMAPASGCWEAPATEEQRVAERWKMVAEVVSAAQQLVNAGKCVVWAGAREIDRAGSPIAEAQRFNQLLRNVQSMFPGKFFYADYSAFSFQNEALRSSLDGPGGDRIHPNTPEANQAIANFAFWTSVYYCGASPELP